MAALSGTPADDQLDGLAIERRRADRTGVTPLPLGGAA